MKSSRIRIVLLSMLMSSISPAWAASGWVSSGLEGKWKGAGPAVSAPFQGVAEEYLAIIPGGMDRLRKVGLQNQKEKFKLSIPNDTGLFLIGEDGRESYANYRLHEDQLRICSFGMCRDYERVAEFPEFRQGTHSQPSATAVLKGQFGERHAETRLTQREMREALPGDYNWIQPGRGAIDLGKDREYAYAGGFEIYHLGPGETDLSDYAISVKITRVPMMGGIAGDSSKAEVLVETPAMRIVRGQEIEVHAMDSRGRPIWFQTQIN